MFFSSLTSQTTSSTTQPHKIPATNLRNAIFTMCVLTWVLFSNMLKETHAVDYVGQSFPEVGWYGKTCFFSLWILVVKSAVRIWMCLDCFSSLTSPPAPAAPHNRTKYQQPTCAMQFSPCVFLHGFCPVFQHAEGDTCSRLCWSKFSIRLVGTVKLVCFFVNSVGEKCS